MLRTQYYWYQMETKYYSLNLAEFMKNRNIEWKLHFLWKRDHSRRVLCNAVRRKVRHKEKRRCWVNERSSSHVKWQCIKCTNRVRVTIKIERSIENLLKRKSDGNKWSIKTMTTTWHLEDSELKESICLHVVSFFPDPCSNCDTKLAYSLLTSLLLSSSREKVSRSHFLWYVVTLLWWHPSKGTEIHVVLDFTHNSIAQVFDTHSKSSRLLSQGSSESGTSFYSADVCGNIIGDISCSFGNVLEREM